MIVRGFFFFPKLPLQWDNPPEGGGKLRVSALQHCVNGKRKERKGETQLTNLFKTSLQLYFKILFCILRKYVFVFPTEAQLIQRASRHTSIKANELKAQKNQSERFTNLRYTLRWLLRHKCPLCSSVRAPQFKRRDMVEGYWFKPPASLESFILLYGCMWVNNSKGDLLELVFYTQTLPQKAYIPLWRS